jgi:hypothetical protein
MTDSDLPPAGYQMAEDFEEAYKNLLWTAVFSSTKAWQKEKDMMSKK